MAGIEGESEKKFCDGFIVDRYSKCEWSIFLELMSECKNRIVLNADL